MKNIKALFCITLVIAILFNSYNLTYAGMDLITKSFIDSLMEK